MASAPDRAGEARERHDRHAEQREVGVRRHREHRAERRAGRDAERVRRRERIPQQRLKHDARQREPAADDRRRRATRGRRATKNTCASMLSAKGMRCDRRRARG